MHSLRALLHRRFGLVGAILAMALVVRAMVPQGYMPDAGNGTLAVKLCNSGQVVHIPIPGKEHERGEGHDREQQPCAFGALASAAAQADAFAQVPLPQVVNATYRQRAEALVFAQERRQRPPSRAPPVLS